MGDNLRRSAAEAGVSMEASIEEWPYLDEGVLLKTRSRKVCMTCHWFRHHAGVNCIPLLTFQLHQDVFADGQHLTSRCQGWTGDGRHVLTSGPLAGSAGANSWSSRWGSCCQINRYRCYKGDGGLAARVWPAPASPAAAAGFRPLLAPAAGPVRRRHGAGRRCSGLKPFRRWSCSGGATAEQHSAPRTHVLAASLGVDGLEAETSFGALVKWETTSWSISTGSLRLPPPSIKSLLRHPQATEAGRLRSSLDVHPIQPRTPRPAACAESLAAPSGLQREVAFNRALAWYFYLASPLDDHWVTHWTTAPSRRQPSDTTTKTKATSKQAE